MKKYYIVFLFMVLITSACESFLEENPKDIITSVNFYKTAKDAESAVLGIYAANATNTWAYQFVELHSDYSQGRGTWGTMINWNLVFDPTHIDRTELYMWAPSYRAINRANNVLLNVPPVVMDETEKKRLLGEAYFLRAYYYFNLVRGFGSIPLQLSAVTKGEISVPKSSENEVYDQIIEDLKIAETDLKNSVGANTARASKWAAKMVLADVYLTLEDWTNAAAKAEEVINSGMYSLLTVTTPDDFYNMYATQTHVEDIWSLHFSELIQDGWVTAFHRANIPAYNNQSSGYYTVMPISINQPFRTSWDDNDLRKSFNYYTNYVNASGVLVNLPSTTPILYKKYITRPDGIKSNSRPLIRYTEAFLIYAEAAAMANGSPTALALERLNMIKRRGYGYDPTVASPVDYPSGMTLSDFRDAVLLERKYEFVNECKRWWDLKRIGKVKEAIETEFPSLTFNEYRLLWPIPQNEINNNTALTQNDQNPGY